VAVTPKPNVLRPCAIRAAGGARRLVCLQLAGTPVVREYEVTVKDGNGTPELRATAPIDPRAIALFSVERSATVRDVYAVTTDAQVLGVLGPSVAPVPGAHPAAGTVTDAVLLPACDGGQAAQLVLRVVTATEKRLQAMPPLGGPVVDYHGVTTDLVSELAVRDTGCITELQPMGGGEPPRRQAAVVEIVPRAMPGTRASTSVVFECDLDPTRCRVSLPVPGTGAGLTPPPRIGAPPGAPVEEPRLTGMFFDASGVVMSSWVLLPTPGGGELRLVERERVPSAAIPGSVVSGHFDGDGLLDMFWDLQNAVLLTSNLQVTYGRKIGAQRLSALSGSESIFADAVLAGELTGDGVDDLVLFGRRREDDGTTTSGFVVVPMNVPIPNPDPGFDRPCR